jgi:hypothetical protein
MNPQPAVASACGFIRRFEFDKENSKVFAFGYVLLFFQKPNRFAL